MYSSNFRIYSSAEEIELSLLNLVWFELFDLFLERGGIGVVLLLLFHSVSKYQA